MSSARKVLVCGATGFIGRNVAERLAARNDLEVIGIYNRVQPFQHDRIKMVQADLTREEDVARVLRGVDVVIQAAATTSGSKDIVTRPHIHVTDNAVMNSLIFRAAHDLKVGHIVFFSCSVMYPTGLGRPAKETDFTGEIYPAYFGVGWTKVYIEKMAEFYSRLGATKYSIVRHSNVYGPHDKFDLERSHVFGATVTKVLGSQDGKLRIWGEGTEERDLIYVSDLVDYVELAIDRQKAPFDLSNVGAGESIAIKDLVSRIIAHSGRTLSVEHDLSKPTIPTKLCLDITKARAQLGWQPRVSLDEGIRKTLAWCRQGSQ